MIIKTKAWKNGKSGKLQKYILDGSLSHGEGGFTLYHNASYPSLKGIAKDFDKLIEKSKTNPYLKNLLNHHILAFSPEDNEKLDGGILQQLTEKYLQESGLDRTTCFAKVHRGKNGGFHVHTMAANVPVGLSNKSLRISKAKYKQVRLDMERYQLHEFDLTNSVVHLDLNKKKQRDIEQEDKNRRKENEYQARKWNTKTLRKDHVKNTLDQLIHESTSVDDFFDNILQTDGLEVYHRGGRPYGVTYQGKNYRFDTLGLETHILALDNLEEQLINERLKALEKTNTKTDRKRNLGR